MSYNVLVTTNFKKEVKALIKKYQSLKTDIANLVRELKKKPDIGVSLGRNCYKVRLAIYSKGRGKSGGARVITLVRVINKEVHLLTIYDKGKRDTISGKEIQKLIEQVDIS